MKRMTENPIGYYTVKADDIKNVVPSDTSLGLYTYTPSPEFLEVLNEFKSALRIDWMKVNEPISHKIGAPFSILYPIGKPFLMDGGYTGYTYSGGQMTKMVNPTFFELDGTYYIQWASLTQ